MISQRIKQTLKQLLAYKSAVAGMAIIIFLLMVSIYAVVTIPYDEAVKLWRAGEEISIDNPRNALPTWITFFAGKNLPQTIILNTNPKTLGVQKVIIPGDAISIARIELSFDYQYDDFPKEINMFFSTKYNLSSPYVSITWTKPNGETYKLKDFTIKKTDRYYISIDEKLAENLRLELSDKISEDIQWEIPPHISLFVVEDESILSRQTAKSLKGKYKMVIDATFFEREVDIDTKLVVYGQVYGIAGTDHLRRDLRVALLWGAPIASSFGILASISISFLQMVIAALSAWYGKWVDTLLQKLTEVNMILPFLPILILISVFYKINIWVLLAVVVALSVFGGGVKTYRAMFLQVKEMPYVEAAMAYGAKNLRIIFRYLIPKVLPTIIPSLVLSVSSFVFLEAALAILGLGDPLAPTWGKVINDAYENGALLKGYYYWVLEPSFLLVLTSLGFAMLGFALDKIFNPKLREL